MGEPEKGVQSKNSLWAFRQTSCRAVRAFPWRPSWRFDGVMAVGSIALVFFAFGMIAATATIVQAQTATSSGHPIGIAPNAVPYSAPDTAPDAVPYATLHAVPAAARPNYPPNPVTDYLASIHVLGVDPVAPRHAMEGAAAAPQRAPAQAGTWQEIALTGATCGRGAQYKYYLNTSTDPEAGIFILLNGGGVCLKDGHAPTDATGAAQQLYCMDYGQFTDPTMSLVAVNFASNVIPYVRRDVATNPLRNFNFVWVPYCTGDIFSGTMTEAYDYDPSPDGKFEVVHRGRLNFLALLDDLKQRIPGDVPVVLSGMSAGGFGAIFNFPEVIRRWPHTALVPDAGIAPPHPLSLMNKRGPEIAARWAARAVLPDYCPTDDCLGDTLHLLQAHAAHYSGMAGSAGGGAGAPPWRPFGYLQGQQDGTLSAFLEISACSYETGLRIGRAGPQPANLRAWIPATDHHVFTVQTTAPMVTTAAGVNYQSWFAQVALAKTQADMPADAVDPWLKCHPTYLPGLWWGAEK